MPRWFSTIWFALALAFAASSARAAETFVFIYDYYFTPTNLTIAPGDKVTWINKGFQPHDTTSLQGLWASPQLFNDEEFFSYTFTEAGVYPYICLTHIADYPDQTGLVVVASANLAPSVQITSPANGASFTAPASFAVTAQGTDSDGTVTSIQLLVNGTPVGSSQGATFTTNVSSLAAGNYSFTAIATDDQGATTTSQPVNVVVGTPVKFPLAVSVAPSNGGAVVADPLQPVDGYDAGTVITLTASAASGFAFSSWSGDASGTQNPLTITMDAAKGITANFNSNTIPTHTLSLATNPPDGGTIQVSSAPNGPNGTYIDGTIVTLTAVPAVDFAFTNWSGDVSSVSNSITLTVSQDISVTANFVVSITPRFTLTLVTNPPGAGAIQALPSPGTNDTYPQGTIVTLTATGVGTNVFTNWTGSVSSTSNRITIAMDADQSLTANFVPIIPPTHTLTILVTPTNAGTVLRTPLSANGVYAEGTTVALAAQPMAGFRFKQWTGAVNSISNPILLVMDNDKSVTALFEPLASLSFSAASGVYAGLFIDESGTNFSSANYTGSGLIVLRVSRSGAYRGTATIGGMREFVAGQFDRFGYAPLVARHASLSGSLQIDETLTRITGVITDGQRSPALLLYRGTTTNIAALAGNYSANLAVAAPVQEGAITFQILGNGVVRMHGTLGDGTAFTERTFISIDSRIPIFVPLYGNRGALLGWLDIATDGTGQGTIGWYRPGNSRSLSYPQGFGLKIAVAGSRVD